MYGYIQLKSFLLLALIFTMTVSPVFPAFAQVGDQNGIPPTPAFSSIDTPDGNVTATEYNSQFTFVAGNGIDIITDWFTNTITFTTTAFGAGGGCDTIGQWMDSFNATSENFDCNPAQTNATGEANTASNLGTSGEGVFSSKVLLDFEFKKLVGTGDTTVTSNATNIIIDSTGEQTTASNLGSGEGVFFQKTVDDLEFKTLIAGDGVTLSSNSTTITFNSTGGVSDGDKGDIVISGSGTVYDVDVGVIGNLELGTGLDTTQLADGTVTDAELQFINTLTSNAQTQINSKLSDITGESIHDLANVTSTGCATGEILKVSGASWICAVDDNSGSGEINTASNVGAGVGVFDLKNVLDLEFNSLIGGNAIDVTDTVQDITIGVTTGSIGDNELASSLDVTQLADGTVTNSEFQFINTLTSNAQTQINSKLSDITGESIHDLANVTSTGCATGEVLKVSGTSWICAVDDNTGADGNDFEVSDGDKTDITVTASGLTWNIDTGVVGDNELASNLDVTQLADGTVTNSEFQFINTLTSNAQTQINSKLSDITGESIHDLANVTSTGCATGEVLKVSGTSWICAVDDNTGGTNDLLDGTAHSDTVAQTVSRGSVIIGDSTPAWNELLIGGATTVLKSNGTDIAWGTDLDTNDFEVTDGDKTDITVSASGLTWNIDTGVVGDNELASSLDVTQLADGTVTNSEFQFINTLTSNAQTQINSKLSDITGESIHDLANVTSTGCAANEILKVSGASWICATDVDTNDFEVTDADKNDITVSSSGTVWEIDTGVIGDNELASSLDVTQLADGTVTDSEFQFINTLTSNAQTQINSKLSDITGESIHDLANVTSTGCATGEVLKVSGASWVCAADDDSGGSGEINTASNVGAGIGIFDFKNVLDLEFNSLIAGAGIDIVDTIQDLTISITAGSIGDTELASNLDVTQLADGTVTNSEFQFINTLTSNAQTQINSKLSDITGESIHDLANVTSTGCAANEILKVSGASWICATDVDTNDFEVTDGDKTDITVSASGLTWNIDTGVIGDNELASNLDVTQLADGTVTDSEFQFINTLSSNAQTQINSKLSDITGESIHDLANVTSTGCASGEVLKVSGTSWICGVDNNSGGTNALLDATAHTDTVAQTVSRGSIIYGDSTPAWNELPIGTNTHVLTSDGTDISWQAPAGGSSDIISEGDSNVEVIDLGTGQVDIDLDGVNEYSLNATDFDMNTNQLAGSMTCTNGQILEYNSSTDTWDCGTDDGGGGVAQPKVYILPAGGAQMQITNTCAKQTIDGTNMDYVICAYDPTTSETAVWNWEVPTNFSAAGDIVVDVRFQVASGTAGVCWDASFLDLTSGDTVDGTFTAVRGGCDATTGTNAIETASITFTSAQHSIDAGDIVYFKLSRDVADATDTNTNDARLIDIRVEWN